MVMYGAQRQSDLHATCMQLHRVAQDLSLVQADACEVNQVMLHEVRVLQCIPSPCSLLAPKSISLTVTLALMPLVILV